MAMIPMTAQEFFGNFVQILRTRLGGKPQPPDLLQFEQELTQFPQMEGAFLNPEVRTRARTLLGEIPAIGTTTGSCNYTVIVNGQPKPFCILDVTQTECSTLHGDFTLGGKVCHFENWP
jgi:hypothetical protein